jgi:hypothetical protein
MAWYQSLQYGTGIPQYDPYGSSTQLPNHGTPLSKVELRIRCRYATEHIETTTTALQLCDTMVDRCYIVVVDSKLLDLDTFSKSDPQVCW